MKPLLGILTLSALLATLPVAISAGTPDPAIGTWKLNPAKSTANTPTPKSETRTYTASGDDVTLTWVRVGTDGKTSTVRTTFKYDGKDYPATGSTDFDTMSAKRIDANTVELTQKLNGKETGVARRTVAEDGKTMTLHQRRRTMNDEEVASLMVYDRQ